MNIKSFRMTTDNIASIIIVCFFLSHLINQVVDDPNQMLSFILGVSGFLFIFKGKESKVQIEGLKIILWFALFYFFMLVSLFHTQNMSSLGEIIFNLQYVGIALLLIKYKINLKVILFSFYIHVLFFMFHMLEGSDPNTIMAASRNIISILMLIQTSLVYISLLKNNNKITYLPALLTFIISFWAMGRSGILSSSFLLLGIFLVILNSKNRKRNITLTVSLIIFITYLFNVSTVNFRLIDSLSNNYDMIYQRAQMIGFHDPARTGIFKEYKNEMSESFISFMLGVPFKDHSIFANYNNNLHNSYLKLHAYFGFFGFLMFFLSVILAIQSYIKQKKMLYVFIFLALLLRITTDTVAFSGIMDPLLFYFIINGMQMDKIKKKQGSENFKCCTHV